MLYRRIDRCRACDSDRIPEVLSLGDFALSDFLPSRTAHTDRAPLTLLRCEECTLVQLAHTVDRNRLYSAYWYRSATQPAMVQALQDVVRDAQNRVALHAGDVVLDIGANDGTLLAQYPEHVTKLAFEPARNLWPALVEHARIVGGFFPPMQRDDAKPAKIITSIACFYDVDDPGAFVEGIKRFLDKDGVWINQMAYLPDTLETNNFGDFVHEHLTFWDMRSFETLVERHRMHIADYSFNDVNGGSVRFVVGRGQGRATIFDRASQWHDFAERIALQRDGMLHLLESLKGTVVGYGASTKGNTYLQYWGIGPKQLAFIADRNPAKWGKFTPTGQQVIPEEHMRAMRPDYLLVLPFHFIDAFIEREQTLLEHGTQFIVPFPELRLVGGVPFPHTLVSH